MNTYTKFITKIKSSLKKSIEFNKGISEEIFTAFKRLYSNVDFHKKYNLPSKVASLDL